MSVAAFIATIPFTLAAHELGHFLAARALGLRIVFFHAGPVWIDYGRGGARVAVRLRSWLSGGLVKVVLPTTLDSKQRLCFYGSGMLSNFSMGLLQAGAAGWLLHRSAVLAAVSFALHAGASLTCLALAAFPMRVQPWSPMPSDGYRVIQLLRGRST